MFCNLSPKSNTNTFHKLNQQAFGHEALIELYWYRNYHANTSIIYPGNDLVAQHPLKKKLNGRPVVMVPLLLYSDVFSGDRTKKKWNCFNAWCLMLAGLPKQCNVQHENIHLICASNKVSVLQMVQPIVEELLLQEGIEMYDAYNKMFLS